MFYEVMQLALTGEEVSLTFPCGMLSLDYMYQTFIYKSVAFRCSYSKRNVSMQTDPVFIGPHCMRCVTSRLITPLTVQHLQHSAHIVTAILHWGSQ